MVLYLTQSEIEAKKAEIMYEAASIVHGTIDYKYDIVLACAKTILEKGTELHLDYERQRKNLEEKVQKQMKSEAWRNQK